jgi:hypothetical protein
MHEADLASSDLQERARCGSSVRAELQQEDVSRNQSSGSGSSGSFQFVASDTAAYTDLAAIEVVINSVFSGAQACYLRYDQSPNRLWLVNDAGAYSPDRREAARSSRSSRAWAFQNRVA